jgi:hypothetical protein
VAFFQNSSCNFLEDSEDSHKKKHLPALTEKPTSVVFKTKFYGGYLTAGQMQLRRSTEY